MNILKVNMSSPDGVKVDGYLIDGTFHKGTDVVEHPYNPSRVTYDQLDPVNYRIVSHNEPITVDMEWWGTPMIDGGSWTKQTSAHDNAYCGLTHRIALNIKPAENKPKLAAGYNNHNLTEEQVGVAHGYRLLSLEEINAQRVFLGDWRLPDPAEFWHESNKRWRSRPAEVLSTNPEYETIRTNKPADYYLKDRRLAPGHNPNKLTIADVGEGYRLLTSEEIAGPRNEKILQVWGKNGNSWVTPCSCHEHHKHKTYSTSAKPGEYTPSPIAPGHNPHKLTVQQVGEGYRLLTPEEIAAPQRKDYVQYWHSGKFHNISYESPRHYIRDTYRTDLPPGKYIQRKRIVPKTAADLPNTPFWRKYGAPTSRFETGTISSCVNLDKESIASYIARGDTYAVDRNGPWLPFTKEVLK